MIFLILAMLSSALIAVIMRFGSGHVSSKLGMLSMNYVVCTLCAALYAAPGGLAPAHEAMPAAVGLGVVCGVLYLLAFVLLQWNTLRNGVVLASTFMKLGVLVPTLMSVLIFREAPRTTQIIGFVLAIAAILVMNMEKGGKGPGSGIGLLVLLFFGGLADGMAKIFDELGHPALENQYLLYTFVVATALCFALVALKKERIGRGELIYGSVLGVPNFFSAKFLLQALSGADPVPAVVAYPTFSVGAIVLVTLCGVLIFREKLSKKQFLGLGIILAALVLLNV